MSEKKIRGGSLIARALKDKGYNMFSHYLEVFVTQL
jgi:hypothetical protein